MIKLQFIWEGLSKLCSYFKFQIKSDTDPSTSATAAAATIATGSSSSSAAITTPPSTVVKDIPPSPVKAPLSKQNSLTAQAQASAPATDNTPGVAPETAKPSKFTVCLVDESSLSSDVGTEPKPNLEAVAAEPEATNGSLVSSRQQSVEPELSLQSGTNAAQTTAAPVVPGAQQDAKALQKTDLNQDAKALPKGEGQQPPEVLSGPASTETTVTRSRTRETSEGPNFEYLKQKLFDITKKSTAQKTDGQAPEAKMTTVASVQSSHPSTPVVHQAPISSIPVVSSMMSISGQQAPMFAGSSSDLQQLGTGAIPKVQSGFSQLTQIPISQPPNSLPSMNTAQPLAPQSSIYMPQNSLATNLSQDFMTQYLNTQQASQNLTMNQMMNTQSQPSYPGVGHRALPQQPMANLETLSSQSAMQYPSQMLGTLASQTLSNQALISPLLQPQQNILSAAVQSVQHQLEQALLQQYINEAVSQNPLLYGLLLHQPTTPSVNPLLSLLQQVNTVQNIQQPVDPTSNVLLQLLLQQQALNQLQNVGSQLPQPNHQSLFQSTLPNSRTTPAQNHDPSPIGAQGGNQHYATWHSNQGPTNQTAKRTQADMALLMESLMQLQNQQERTLSPPHSTMSGPIKPQALVHPMHTPAHGDTIHSVTSRTRRPDLQDLEQQLMAKLGTGHGVAAHSARRGLQFHHNQSHGMSGPAMLPSQNFMPPTSHYLPAAGLPVLGPGASQLSPLAVPHTIASSTNLTASPLRAVQPVEQPGNINHTFVASPGGQQASLSNASGAFTALHPASHQAMSGSTSGDVAMAAAQQTSQTSVSGVRPIPSSEDSTRRRTSTHGTASAAEIPDERRTSLQGIAGAVEPSLSESRKALLSVSSQISEPPELPEDNPVTLIPAVGKESRSEVKPAKPSAELGQDSNVFEGADSSNETVANQSSIVKDGLQSDTEQAPSGEVVPTDQVDGTRSPAKPKLEAKVSDGGKTNKIGRFQVTKAQDEASLKPNSEISSPMQSPVKSGASGTSVEGNVSSLNSQITSKESPKPVSATVKEKNNAGQTRRTPVSQGAVARSEPSMILSVSDTARRSSTVAASSVRDPKQQAMDAARAATTTHMVTMALSTGAATAGASLPAREGAAASRDIGTRSGAVPLPAVSNAPAAQGTSASAVSTNIE